jgi:hypothetical protein
MRFYPHPLTLTTSAFRGFFNTRGPQNLAVLFFVFSALVA